MMPIGGPSTAEENFGELVPRRHARGARPKYAQGVGVKAGNDKVKVTTTLVGSVQIGPVDPTQLC